MGAQDIILCNFRNLNLTKKTTVYSQDWPEFVCDLKAIEVMMSKDAVITKSENGTTLEIIGYSTEGLEIKIFYDIAKRRIKSHYPDSKRF
ncbi:MAG: hypothetical protein ACXVHM_07345 [Methanobacterium sp.]